MNTPKTLPPCNGGGRNNINERLVICGCAAPHALWLAPMSDMQPPSPPKAIRTPCIQVCVVDGESGLCLGCFRTLGEIGRWSRLTDGERETIMAELSSRRDKIRPEKLGLA